MSGKLQGEGRCTWVKRAGQSGWRGAGCLDGEHTRREMEVARNEIVLTMSAPMTMGAGIGHATPTSSGAVTTWVLTARTRAAWPAAMEAVRAMDSARLREEGRPTMEPRWELAMLPRGRRGVTSETGVRVAASPTPQRREWEWEWGWQRREGGGAAEGKGAVSEVVEWCGRDCRGLAAGV